MSRRSGRRGKWDAFTRYADEKEAEAPLFMERLVTEATNRLAVSIRLLTPVGKLPEDVHGGEKLIESIRTTPAHKDADSRGYSGTVSSSHHAVMPIEYGSAPHLIMPHNGKALKLANGRYASEVYHPGHRGHHMFQKGAAAFEAGELDDIADKHIEEYLE